ncbi:hypothetical protein T190423A01A_110100 [Tenacibaculum sp. 190130A14a]|uniref:Uncharacterized protein n=1 Tax=Tenacibaculum polynesiense TaxID=3137857 RepID=A0ABM9P6Y7_9FLAO
MYNPFKINLFTQMSLTTKKTSKTLYYEKKHYSFFRAIAMP